MQAIKLAAFPSANWRTASRFTQKKTAPITSGQRGVDFKVWIQLDDSIYYSLISLCGNLACILA
jgi:hypothetical protein